jgi:spore maturation protein CgeB
MRIAVVSEFRPGYTVGLEYSYARGFRALGHSAFEIAVPPLATANSQFRRFIYSHWSIRQTRTFVARVLLSNPELIVVVKGEGLPQEAILQLRKAGARCVNVFPDNPFEAGVLVFPPNAIVRRFRAYNKVYVHDRFAVGQLRRLQIESTYIAFAHDPDVHQPATSLRSDTPRPVFIGNPDEERIRYLRAVSDLGLEIWGNWAWAKLAAGDPLQQCVKGGVLVGHAYAAALGSSAIGINVLRHSQKTAHNMRTFELPACRACMLSERSIGVREHFQDGAEMLTFGNPKELRERVLQLLDNHALRHDLAAAGWARVQSQVYSERAQQILSDVPASD